jgi:hypothetical protein
VDSTAYVRLGSRGPLVAGEKTPSLVFVDVDLDVQASELRHANLTAFGRIEQIVVRSEATSLGELERLRDRLDPDHRIRIARLETRVGSEPRLEGDTGSESPSRLLSRLRALETKALLEFGHALWAPADHHYVLPSGRHAAAFVRVADVFRRPRDAYVLATWLFPSARNRLGIVTDSAGLTPLILALHSEMRAAGFELGPAVILDDYPRTELDVRSAIRQAADPSGCVLAVLSVSSSGAVRDRLVRAIQAESGSLVSHHEIHVIVDSAPALSSEVTVWLPDEGGTSPIAGSLEEGRCRLCRDAARAPLVSIDPTSLTALFESQVRMLVPVVTESRRLSVFWEICDAAGAFGLEEPPDEAVRGFRPGTGKMAVHIRWDALIRQTSLAEGVAERISAEQIGEFDLLAVPSHELDRPEASPFWDRVAESVGATSRCSFDWANESQNEAFSECVRLARRIVAFALGSVTGASLQRMLVAIQDIKRATGDSSYKLGAVIVHARPEQRREWQTLSNSYAKRITPLWRSYLPHRSPIQAERVTLGSIDPTELSEQAREFYETRRQLTAGGLSFDNEPLFLGGRITDRLSPQSIFGERLSPVGTYVAVGAAMQAAREEAGTRSVPERRVFEMPAMVRSYYDPLILASFLRWLTPSEAWWGWEPNDATTVLADMIERTSQESRVMLIAELLLAAAQGKVPAQAIETIVGRASAAYSHDPVPVLEVGLALTRTVFSAA